MSSPGRITPPINVPSPDDFADPSALDAAVAGTSLDRIVHLGAQAGVRYSLYSPPYETNGLQVQPTISMGQWFADRVANMQAGVPSSASPIVTFDLSGPKNNRPGFYAWDKNNFAPRFSFAWSPTAAEGGFLRFFTGDNDLVIRGGYTKVFDRVGVGLANNFDEGFAFGMSTTISSPFGAAYELDPRVRFVSPTTLPPTVPAPPPGGFPQTPRTHSLAHAGAYPDRRVLLFSQRTGNTSKRPAKSLRKSATFSATDELPVTPSG